MSEKGNSNHGRLERCFFLEALPAELRVMVYENLLVDSEPITASPREKLKEPMTLDLELLRTNRQIHDEAAAVFYSKNTISVRPDVMKIPSSGIPAPQYHHLIRHLKVEGLYCPNSPGKEWVKKFGGHGEERDGKQEAEEYVSTISTLLLQLRNLHTLHFTITPPDRISSTSVLAMLLPLQNALPSMLANFSPSVSILMSFEFDDCYCRMRVCPGFLAKDCLLVVACQVLFWKSHLRVEKMVREARGANLKGIDGRTDLGGLVGEGVEKVVETGWEVDGMIGRLAGL
ncbi:uncharacterized protein N0V89_004078 [Didymosphaeria variabile]|uniref:Uncharacterized protein n=1 Tax=Didymosphaeria variabile TaxID=1932322 RepID=A0A9W9CD99_9PLEO|nr:uncharacterized protein N0V89_004078 [Didymosphaeria variabile]KAJ4356051.1 hypothetical protein N0V89_004078 [Didymosphaeria variabile]